MRCRRLGWKGCCDALAVCTISRRVGAGLHLIGMNDVDNGHSEGRSAGDPDLVGVTL